MVGVGVGHVGRVEGDGGEGLNLEYVGWFRNEAVHTHTYHVPGNGMTTRERLPWRLTTITTITTTHRSRQGNRTKINHRIKKIRIRLMAK